MKHCSSKFKIDIKKRAYLYALQIIKLLDQLPKSDFTSQIIARQLLRSAPSIGANIIEARASSSKKEFTNFLNQILKSTSNKANRESVDCLLTETKELANSLPPAFLA
jgi:four helix bundle protein